jgi:hypothetical protein
MARALRPYKIDLPQLNIRLSNLNAEGVTDLISHTRLLTHKSQLFFIVLEAVSAQFFHADQAVDVELPQLHE